MTTTTEAEAKINSKVETILGIAALAESASTEEERANAQDKINRLMAKWAIDQARIDAAKAKGQVEALVEKETEPIKGSWEAPFEMLIYGLARAGQMRALERKITWGENKGAKIYYLLGFESDVDQALILFNSLRAQAELAVKKAAREGSIYSSWFNTSDKYKARREFVTGFVAAALEKIRVARAEALEEAKADDRTITANLNIGEVAADDAPVGAELAIASKLEKVEDFVNGKYSKLGTARGRSMSGGYGTGYAPGRAAGERANIGTSKGIGTGPGQLRG